MTKSTITVLGAGSWGTAVAVHLAQAGNRVFLWSRDKIYAEEMQKKRCNTRYLPDVVLPESLTVEHSLSDCLQQAEFTIVAVPSHGFTDLLKDLTPRPAALAWLTKGVDPDTHDLFSTIVQEAWGADYPVAIISGPSFAREVAHGMPTALTLAGNNLSFLQALRELLHYQNMRVYLSNDVIGVQLSGAIKNILAIACGISDGLGFGANAKAALITRGLAEMRRLGHSMGASDESFMGLAGVGDLVLTCTDDQSRNRRFGLKLGQNISIEEAEKQIGQVVEGKYNAVQICAIAQQHQVDMPICQQVEMLLKGLTTPQQAVYNLMSRIARDE